MEPRPTAETAASSTIDAWLANEGALPPLLMAIDQRVDNLLAMRKRFHEFSGTSKKSQRAAVAVAEKLFDLGRTWEAEAWSAIATTLTDDLAANLNDQRTLILRSLAEYSDWVNAKRFAELRLDHSSLTLPKMLPSQSPNQSTESNSTRVALGSHSHPIKLVDETKQRGIEFYGKVGDQVAGPRVALTQSVGCGGAVIDFDNNGLSDLIFAAAGGRSQQCDSDPGRIYRNLCGLFLDVTNHCGTAVPGFGQGISVGDYNDDGFADLYFLDLGENRLFRSNGDGTFKDVTKACIPSVAATWSTSGAIVDIDGDGFNHLISVNYCDGNQSLDMPCYDKRTGDMITCSPMQFMGGRDEFFRGNGDGTFADVSEAWTVQASPGRGLGIVAGKLDGQQMGVYIANDMSANDYYVRRSASGPFSLAEVAISSGIAVDAQTQSQASMGIAMSDLDNDGDLDIYVTGFSGEYNIFYEQVATSYWVDKTISLGLAKPSLNMVVFGTVASDLYGDSLDELLVINGNVGESPPYALPFQLFRRTEQGLFVEENVQPWGDYFAAAHIGRALWTSDADADGRTDFEITHQTEPAVLFMNRSDDRNQFVGFRLIGTSSTRDAIIRFDIQRDKERLSKTLFLTTGSGSLCSNEPVLRCGTAETSTMENLRVIWANGTEQRFGECKSGREYLIIEGENELIEPRILK